MQNMYVQFKRVIKIPMEISTWLKNWNITSILEVLCASP